LKGFPKSKKMEWEAPSKKIGKGGNIKRGRQNRRGALKRDTFKGSEDDVQRRFKRKKPMRKRGTADEAIRRKFTTERERTPGGKKKLRQMKRGGNGRIARNPSFEKKKRGTGKMKPRMAASNRKWAC